MSTGRIYKPKATRKAEACKQFETYYDSGRKTYWITNDRGQWIEVTETALRRFLKQIGLSPKPPEGCFISPLETRLMAIQTKWDVGWAGSLAGHHKGIAEADGHRILVKDSPKLVEPSLGEWPVIAALLEGLFDDEECDQRPYVFGWLQSALECLHRRQFRFGQALAIAGPRDCGKSLFQNHIVTPLLGGRSAKPYHYMSGGTDFNGELFGAEHLLIEDEVASTDIRARRHFGGRIKDFVANETQRHHAKNRQGVSLLPFWRITISVNDEPENLLVLPPIDESLADKIMLLRAGRAVLSMPTGTLNEQEAFRARLKSELPAFAHHLLHEFRLPEELRSERAGVVHYHHPAIMAALDELSPELRLAELIDLVLFDSLAADPWTGTANELQRRLRESKHWPEINRVLTFANACGTYLGRLANKHPERYSRRLRDGINRWTIIPPRN